MEEQQPGEDEKTTNPPKEEESKQPVHHEPEQPKEPKKPLKETIITFFDKNYKKLLIIPFAMLLLGIILIGVQFGKTGDFINRDISLKGGLTLTAPTDVAVDIISLEKTLKQEFPGKDISVRTLRTGGTISGIIIDAEIDGSDQQNIDKLLNDIEQALGHNLNADEYSIEFIGSSLGSSFFKETIIALLIAFLFMGIVVFFIFRSLIPSAAVILAALSDIIVTLGIVNLLGIKLSTAGIAAFLMLIGYSVDTDILLSTRVLKRKEGSVTERVYGAFKTGMTMTITTLLAVTVALILTDSDVIAQIMTILLIGLLVDIINTWIQNVGLLRWYLERKERK